MSQFAFDSTLLEQLESIKQFYIGQSVYTKDWETDSLLKHEIDSIDIAIVCNSYAHIRIALGSCIGNIVGAVKIEDFNRTWFTDESIAKSTLGIE